MDNIILSDDVFEISLTIPKPITASVQITIGDTTITLP